MIDGKSCNLQAGGVPERGFSSRWLAAYTRPRHERKVKDYCEEQGCKVFLPTYQTWRAWSDRRKLLQLPLFPSYVFVQVDSCVQSRVMRAPGFLWFVHNSQGPVQVNESELDAISRVLASGLEFDPLPSVELGDEVEITTGSLTGCRGRLISKAPGALALVISAINGGVRVVVPDPVWIRPTHPVAADRVDARPRRNLSGQVMTAGAH